MHEESIMETIGRYHTRLRKPWAKKSLGPEDFLPMYEELAMSEPLWLRDLGL